jgi:hypothetical protein
MAVRLAESKFTKDASWGPVDYHASYMALGQGLGPMPHLDPSTFWVQLHRRQATNRRLPESMFRARNYDVSDDPGPVTTVEWVDAPDDDLPGW